MRLDRDWSDLAFTCKNCYVGMRQDAENCFKERLNRLSRASHRANARCTGMRILALYRYCYNADVVKAIFSIQHVFLERQRITIAIGGGITGFKDTTSSANLDHLTHILAVDVKMCRFMIGWGTLRMLDVLLRVMMFGRRERCLLRALMAILLRRS